jgi:two-component system, cell cycle sensor histidine kinase and response regulator CckA
MDIDRYKLILDFATEGFWDWDLKADRAYLSPRYCEMIGYSPGDTVFDTAFLKKIIYPDDQQRVFQVIEEYFQGKRNTSVVEHRMITKDGTVRWMETRGNVVEYDEKGTPSRMVGTIVDITERKLAEMERGQYFNFFTTSLELMCIAGLDGFFKKTNPSFSRTLGYSEQELLAKPLIEFIHPDDRQATGDEIARQLNGAIVTAFFENRYLCKDGKYRWLSWNAYYDDDKKLIFGIARDITEQKRVAEEISHSQKLLSSIIDNAPYAVFVKEVNNDFRIVLWNKSSETIFGIPAAAVLGKSSGDVMPQEQAKAYLADDRFVVSNRTALDIPEEPGTHRGKGKILLHTRKIPLFDNNDKVSHIVVICEDITEHSLMQAELLKSQKLESLGVLAGGIAHDFNNILTGILGNISYARKLLDESQKPSKILQAAENASYRASDLASQLLTFAKGSQPIIKFLSVKNLIEASASFVLRGSNVSSTTDIPDSIHAIKADEGQINQVLSNILINATQAMPEGGTILIRAENITIDSVNMMLPSGEYIKLSISDTGTGISEEDQKKIFDPYFTTKKGGNGLGLAMAYSIIKKHGGHISVHSVIGKGSTFEILLPASHEKVTYVERGTVSMELGTEHDKTVLVMDDEEIIRDLASMILTDLGYRVKVCANGEEALELYKSGLKLGSPFSAVIMDLTIPGGMGGKEAAQHIIKIDPDAKLIVSSGYSTDPIMAEYTDFGFKATLLKPYSIEEIMKTLDSVLLVK